MSKYLSGNFAYRVDVGRVRLSNEDNAVALTNSKGNVLLLVCDGMGGQSKGDLASNLATSYISEEFKNKKSAFLTLGGAIHWLKKTIRSANMLIFNESSRNEEYQGMGTTLTCALIIKSHMIVAQIGDSRCYRLTDKKFEQLSEDQTYVAYLLRTGQITPEEAKTHPKRHVLLNALGIYPSVNSDIELFAYNDETILLCSDGLYNNVLDKDIANVLKGDDTVEQKINELIQIANANGGSDNIAVVLWEASKQCL